mmetsp:Transcript_309/g.559  ORF Transcript_309/g.559 Transcript_309/m.559 type:complete len:342 (+) Transcript_309:64-1089(+)
MISSSTKKRERISMRILADDIVVHMASYLWFSDLFSFTQTSQRYHHLIHSHIHLYTDLLANMLQECFFYPAQYFDPLIHSNRYTRDDLIDYVMMLYARIPCWPNTVDLAITSGYRGPDHIHRVCVEGKDHNIEWIAYTGELRKSLRSIVSNNCFPYFPNHRECSQIPVPKFTRAFMDSRKSPRGVCHVSLSSVAYFETTIHTAINRDGTYTTQTINTVTDRYLTCVGLSCPPFSLRDQLPGFDRFSLGYISDGGLFFQGGIGQAFGASGYGPGDTIGCGIVYPTPSTGEAGKIFLTKNGKLQGNPLNILNSSFFPNTLVSHRGHGFPLSCINELWSSSFRI